MDKKDIIDLRAVALQNNCHNHISECLKLNSKLTHQDLTNVWMFRKLAEMEYEIAINKSSNQPIGKAI